MNLDAFKEIAASNNWLAIWPEIGLGIFALVLLVLDLLVKPEQRAKLGGVTMAVMGFLLLGVLLFTRPAAEAEAMFGGLLLQNSLTFTGRLFFLLSGILTCWIGGIYLAKQDLPRTEFYMVVAIVTGALMLLVQSNHFILFFVALETVTIGFYILVSYCRNSPYSLEAGLKYLILGGLSTAILLFGIVLLYGAASTPGLPAASTDPLNFQQLLAFLSANPGNPIALVGAALVVGGIAFKIGTVPFQIWIPDVYQGAPTPVTAFLAVGSKAAGFFVLLVLVRGPFAPLGEGLLLPLLSAMAIVTILFGNLTAINQRNVKRMMGLSGVAHAGYLLLGICAVVATDSVAWASFAVVFYLMAYLLASFAVFGVMALTATNIDEVQELAHYKDFAKNQPYLAAALAVGLGSLAGIPPLAGFIGKLLLFVAALQAGLYTLVGVAIIGVVISIYYYFGWIREAYFKSVVLPEEVGSQTRAPIAEPQPISGFNRFILGILTVLTVLLGVWPGLFGGGPLG